MSEDIRHDAMAYLMMFSRMTYSLSSPRKEVRTYLENHGYIEWVPPTFGGINFGITEKGRAATKLHDPLAMENP